MKKLLCAALLVGLFAGAAQAWTIGTLARMNATEAEYGERSPLNYTNTTGKLIRDMLLAEGLNRKEVPAVKFYDSQMAMQLGLNRGEVDAIVAPDFVGEYILRNAPEYCLKGFFLLKRQIAIAIGFSEERAELCKRFDEALKALTENGMTSHLARYYLSGPEAENPQPVAFDKFEGAETVNVLVTGDIPPLDYVDAGGTPAGYNTALLAELGRWLHVNINLVSSESGTRVAALTSGRVDAVFWIEIMPDGKQFDKPEGVLVTRPYYGWSKVFLIGVKGK